MVNSWRRHPAPALLFLVFLLVPGSLYSKSLKESPHGDTRKLPKGCASCHTGHGKPNTPMLIENRDVFCFQCHGNERNAQEARKKGKLGKETKAADLQREFEKPYRHPIERTGIHAHGETLPETNPSIERHSECADCHHQHYVTEKNKHAGVKGISMNRARVREVSFEYELCFKCHLESANLPANQIGKVELFDMSNPSFHPVVAPGKNSDAPSLVNPLTASSLIKCTDCHNNDDPKGPRGPHGSNYRYILARNYTETDGAEGPLQYALCYGCHRRNSILGNESFQFHNLHIVFVGASCRTCHNSHGSAQYTHLIDFETSSVRPSKSGRLEFIDLGRRAGECFLTCHGKNHDPIEYPNVQKKPPEKKSTTGSPGVPGFFNFQRFR